MLKRLIKESCELRRMRRWLKLIDKEIKKQDKHYKEFKRHQFIAKELAEEYFAWKKKQAGDSN